VSVQLKIAMTLLYLLYYHFLHFHHPYASVDDGGASRAFDLDRSHHLRCFLTDGGVGGDWIDGSQEIGILMGKVIWAAQPTPRYMVHDT
jgi:hypothetical protein